MFAAFGPDPDMQLYGRGLRQHLPTMLGADQRRLRMAYSLRFALPGTPTLFYGEEIGMGENLAVEDRLAVRTPMQWAAGPTARFSAAPPDGLCRPLPQDERFAPAAVNVADQRRDPESLLNWFERMIRLRKELPAIGWGRCSVLDGGVDAVLVLRYDWDDDTIITAHNLARRAVTAQVSIAAAGDSAALHDLRQPGRPLRLRNGTARIPLRAYDHRWFRLSADWQPQPFCPPESVRFDRSLRTARVALRWHSL